MATYAPSSTALAACLVHVHARALLRLPARISAAAVREIGRVALGAEHVAQHVRRHGELKGIAAQAADDARANAHEERVRLCDPATVEAARVMA